MDTLVVSAQSGFSLRDIKGAIKDLGVGLARWKLWTAFAIEDMRQVYRRSILGAFWISVSFAVFIAVKFLIFGSMIGAGYGDYFTLYLTIGFFVWQFMSQVVTTSTNIFLQSEGWIKNESIELPVFAFQNTVRSVFDACFTGAVVVLILIFFRRTPDIYWISIVPALIFYVLNALWVSIFIGIVCARFRDLSHLIQTIMRVMFFLTPIFWLPAQLGDAMKFLFWNPFAHFLWILRTPILDQTIPWSSWIFVGSITLAGWIGALLALAVARRRLPFWF